MLTKKAKIEQYDAVTAERDLLQLYMHDTQSGVDPIIVRKGAIRANLYRATGASGGYVVIKETVDGSCNTWIRLFEDAYRELSQHYVLSPTPENEAYRTVIERCRIERQKLLNAERDTWSEVKFSPTESDRTV